MLFRILYFRRTGADSLCLKREAAETQGALKAWRQRLCRAARKGIEAMFEKDALRKKEGKRVFEYSGTTLKLIGAVLVTIGTIGVAILRNGLLGLDDYSTASLLAAMKEETGVMQLVTAALFCSFLAGMALPVYAFLLVEGYRHTADIKRYILRMVLLALVSELPYDFAMCGRWFDFSEQNPLFGMVIALLLLYFMDYFGKRQKGRGMLLRLVLVLAALLWVLLLRVELGVFLVLLPAVLWIFAGNGALTTAMGVAVSIAHFPAPLGFIFNHFYSGKKGGIDRRLFYVYYPLQLLVIGLIGKYMV